MMLAGSLPDISKVPADFTQWYIILSCFFIMIGIQVFNTIFNVWDKRQTKKAEISGTIESTHPIRHAEQSDLDELTKTVNAMREEITAQFREAQRSGENRVAAITQDVNAEMGGLSLKIGDITKMITTALVDNASQGEAINNLKASIHNHQLSITSIHRRIDDIVQQSRSKRTST